MNVNACPLEAKDWGGLNHSCNAGGQRISISCEYAGMSWLKEILTIRNVLSRSIY